MMIQMSGLLGNVSIGFAPLHVRFSLDESGERFLAAAIGAGVAECTTQPIDTAKVRLQTQVQRPDGTWRYRGLSHGVYRVARDEGPLALWKGFTPALARQVLHNGCCFLLYEPIRNFIAGNVPKEEVPFWKRALSGGIAGGVTIFPFNPIEVVKTQMQANRGASTTPMRVAHKIWKTGGIYAMFQGANANVARSTIGCTCELGCYDAFKTQLKIAGMADGPLAHFAASSGAGFVSAIVSIPIDVVRTRLMAQAGGGKTEIKAQYKGVCDCLLRVSREEGIGALYTGFVPLAIRKMGWVVTYYLAYEQALGLVRGSYS